MRAASCLLPIVGTLVLALLHGAATNAADAQTAPPSDTNVPHNEHRTLWYTRPAQGWSGEALPIGNGRMGAMLFGGVNSERIQFNENSLWSGDNNWDGDYDCGDHGFGSYRNFGDLFVEFANSSDGARELSRRPRDKARDVYPDYRRKLDIATGIHSTTFSRDGVAFTREAFASRPDQVMVFRYTRRTTAGRPALFRAIASGSRPAGAKTVADAKGLSWDAVMPNKLKHACGAASSSIRAAA